MNSVGSSLKQSTARTRRLLVADTLTAGAALPARLLPAPKAIAALAAWAGEEKIKTQVDVVEGLENAPDALRRLFTGENLGKQLVKIADR